MSTKEILAAIMTVVMAGIFLGYLFPVGMNAFNSADTSNWSTASQGVWSVMPILLILVPLGILAGFAIQKLR